MASKVPKWFWAEAQRADPADRVWTTAIFPHPGDTAAPPADTIEVQFSRGAAGERKVEAEGPAGLSLEGELYVDGSCVPSAVSGFARAACAIVQMNGSRVVKKALAAVPAYLPQTAQAAEHLGMVLIFRYLAGRANVVGDCLGVVKAINASVASMLGPSRRYAGLLADVLRDPARRRLAKTVRWVRSHRKLNDNMDEQEQMDVLGNNAADAAAKEALELHPPVGEEAAAAISYYESRAWLVARAVAAALPLFPPAPGNLRRRPRAPVVAEGACPPWQRHQWRHEEGAWRCRVCATWVVGDAVPANRAMEVCKGPMANEAELRKLGHRPCRAQGACPFTFCSKCGAWAARRSNKLAKPCAPPTSAGVQALRRMEKGLHPWRRRAPGGGEAPRSRIVVSEAHDLASGEWVSVRPTAAGGMEAGGDQGRVIGGGELPS